jgi:hypothetical protein
LNNWVDERITVVHEVFGFFVVVVGGGGSGGSDNFV